ncbi:hypothetical protein Tco_0845129, partial [Tanacetum coccineum]
VASFISVRRPESKESNSKKRVLLNTKSKSTSKDVKKSQSSFSLVSNKRDTLNLNVSESNANVLKAKTVNAVNDGSNLVCVSCCKDVFMISHDKCVARYALSLNSRVKRALFTFHVAAKSSQAGATLVVAKSRFSVATPPKATNKVIQIVLWIVDSGCLKHMTGNLKLLRNFVEKFMGTVRLRSKKELWETETIHVKFDELTTMASECNNSGPDLNCLNFQDSSEDSNEIPSKEDLDNLFGPLYEEYYKTRTPKVSNNYAANTLNNQDNPSSLIIVE